MWMLNKQYRLSCIAPNNSIIIQNQFYNIRTLAIMSWYNTYSDSTRKLEQLVQRKASLSELLQVPEFIQTLKAYQPKVLQYISNSFDIPRDIVRFITETPKDTDSQARKYKWPLLTVNMVETNTTCVINCFFKINPQSQKPFLIEAFDALLSTDKQILPLLCGYFSQTNVVLWNNRYQDTVDMIYDFKSPLLQLANHTYNKALVNTLLLYLNLDMTRNPIIHPGRTQLKLQVLKVLYSHIRSSFQNYKADGGKNDKNEIVIENICEVLIEIVEKYYLITDGKAMLDYVTSQENVELVLSILMLQKSISFTVVGLSMILMRYYCLSSFNQEDINNPDLSKKNQERLESQPFIKKIVDLIPTISTMIGKVSKFTIYNSRLLEIFIPVIELSSQKISKIVKESRFLDNLIVLMFKFPELSILHKQIQRAFFAVFCSDRTVCEEYRKYLFCSASIIEKTAGECLKKVDKIGEESVKIGWFSHLMKIVKVYSKIQTNDQEVNQAIMQRAALWDKFSNCLMRPYQALCFKDLGSYEGIPDIAPVQYTVRTVGGGLEIINPLVCKTVIDELIKEESMPEFMSNDKPEQAKVPAANEDSLFDVQDLHKPAETVQQEKTVVNQLLTMDQGKITMNSPHVQQNAPSITVNEPPKKEEEKIEEPSGKNFHDYFNSKKNEIQQQIATQRRSSKEKRLSANKSRLTSPSPKKSRKWEDNDQQEQPQDSKLVPSPNKGVAPPKIPIENTKKQRLSLTTTSIKSHPPVPQIKSPRNHSEAGAEETRTNPHQISPNRHQQKKEEELVITSLKSLNDEKIHKSISFDGSVPGMSQSMSQSNLGASRVAIEELKDIMSKSAVNFGDLKNMKIKKERLPGKSEKIGRKIGKTDKMLLDFLGYQH